MRITLLVLLVFAIAMQPSTELDTAIAGAIDAYNAQPRLLFAYAERARDFDMERLAGVVYLDVLNRETQQPYPGLIVVMPVVRQGGVWQVAFPGEADYIALRSALPDTIHIDAEPFRPQAEPSLVGTLDDYGLPWTSGQWATVTRSFNQHGTGRIDFDLTGNTVAAAKDGTIIYANDSHLLNGADLGAWWYWNTVVIRHAPHEYTLYGHLKPGSIPLAILEQCSADTSALNCDIPVKRGAAIGEEGNTGWSSAPHLHLEFAQAVEIIGYPDVADQDRDGDRWEPVFAPYLYAEQNAAFEGYAITDVADWSWGRVEQAAHVARAPFETDLIENGDFAAGTDSWTPSGQLNWRVEDEQLFATRLRDPSPPFAAFYQDLPYGALAGDVFEVSLRLGSTSGVPKSVTVQVMNADGPQYGVFGCNYEIAPGAEMQSFRMSGTVDSTWSQVRLQISVNPGDGSPAVVVDDVTLRRLPGAESTATRC